jgi:hypothetical protein
LQFSGCLPSLEKDSRESATGKEAPAMKRMLSIFFAAAPFVVGVLWFFANEQDMNMLWMSLAAYVAAALVMSLPQSRTESRRAMVVFTIFIMFTATLLSALTGYAIGMGTRQAVWIFATALGLCCAGGYAFYSHTNQL